MKIEIKALDESKRSVTAAVIEMGVVTSDGPALLQLPSSVCEQLAVVLRDAADGAAVLRQAHGAPPGLMHVMQDPQRVRSAVSGFLTDGTFLIQLVSTDRRGSEFVLTAKQARSFADSILKTLAEEETRLPPN